MQGCPSCFATSVHASCMCLLCFCLPLSPWPCFSTSRPWNQGKPLSCKSSLAQVACVWVTICRPQKLGHGSFWPRVVSFVLPQGLYSSQHAPTRKTAAEGSWGGGSVGKSTCIANLGTWVWIPRRTHINDFSHRCMCLVLDFFKKHFSCSEILKLKKLEGRKT